MVAKISVSGSLAGAVNYNMNKLKADTAHIILTNTAQPPSSAPFTPQQQPHSSQEPAHRKEQHFENSSIGSSICSLFDMPILPNGDDPEKEMFRRRMQRKKKKRRRM